MLMRRPDILGFVHCTNVTVRGITLRDSGYWVQDYLDCDGVFLSGLTVVSRANGNNDGIDIDGSRNVRVSDCNIDTGDDALCLKASRHRLRERRDRQLHREKRLQRDQARDRLRPGNSKTSASATASSATRSWPAWHWKSSTAARWTASSFTASP